MKTIARDINSAKGIARKGMSTFAAVVLFVLLAPWTSVFASAPVTWYYITGYSWFPTTPYSTADALCSAFVTARNAADPSTVSVCASRTQGPAYIYTDRTNVSNGAVTYNVQYNITPVSRCSDGSAPDTSKPLEQQCGTPAPQCPAAGTAAGTHNFTVGWSYSPTAGSSTIAPPSFPSGTVSIGGCLATVGSVQECYRSPQPSAQGLYRLSCDYELTHTGDSGAPSTSTPDPNAPEPAPNCPGTSGTVNGVAVCLESGTPTPPTFPTPPVVGNPIPGNPNAPGTSPDPSSFDPTTGAGSSSAPGSPGAGGGSGGTGGTTVPSTGGGGSGEGENTGPKECGTPGRPKCQIDETGTPDGKDAFNTAGESLTSAFEDATNQLSNITKSDDKDTSFGQGATGWFTPGACESLNLGDMNGIPLVVNFCDQVSAASNITSFIWVVSTFFGILWLVFNTMRGS